MVTLAITLESFLMWLCNLLHPPYSVTQKRQFVFCHCMLVWRFYSFTNMEPYNIHSSSVWFFSFCILILRFTHVVEYISSAFLVISKQCYVVWISHNLFIQPPVDGHLGCFQFGAVTDKISTNICVQIFIFDICFHFLLGKYLGMEYLDYTIGIY